MNWRFSPSLETITETLLHSATTARIKQMVKKIGEGPKRLKPRHVVRPPHPAHLPQLAPDVLAQHRLDGPRRDSAEIAPRQPVRCHVVEDLGLPLHSGRALWSYSWLRHRAAIADFDGSIYAEVAENMVTS